jgi:RNA polymerase sigma factor (sigma-70 family)
MSLSMNLKDAQTEITTFFQREYSNLIRFLRAKINDLSEMESEDIISDIILTMYSRIGIPDEIENISAYIYKSIHHKAIDYLRKRKRLVSLNEPVSSGGEKTLGELLSDPRLDIHDEIIAREVQTKLYQALEKLDSKQRAVWIATEIDGFTFRELAEMWDQPIGTLLARKHRATEALKKALQDLKPVVAGK